MTHDDDDTLMRDITELEILSSFTRRRPYVFPDEKRFDLLAFSAVSHFNVATRGVILAWQSSVRQSQLAEASYKMAY